MGFDEACIHQWSVLLSFILGIKTLYFVSNHFAQLIGREHQLIIGNADGFPHILKSQLYIYIIFLGT